MLILSIVVKCLEIPVFGFSFTEPGLIQRPMSLILSIFLMSPSVSIMIRRLHDINKSSWWSLLAALPLLNFYYLYLMTKRGESGANKYGDDPLEGGGRTKRSAIHAAPEAVELTPFSDEELARLLPDKQHRSSVPNSKKSRTYIPPNAAKPRTGFGRRGAGDNDGFRGFQSTQQRLGNR